MQMWTGPQIIKTSETAQLISQLLSMRLVDPNEFDDDNSSIKEPVEVTFTFPEKSNVTLSSDLTLRCGELNLYSDSYDKLWHYDACTLINLTVTSVVCQCQKMVDVGIINLIPQEKPEKPESQSENEVYVGFAFSILSCIFLLGVLQTKSEGLDVVIWNLGLTLLLFEICFLFFWMSRLGKTVESVLCYFLLIPVHFSFTATCFWLCCLSIQIFLILIAWKGLCIGVMQILSWVVPIVFVAAIVATFQTSYTEPERCLMTRNILVTFAFPPTAVVAGVSHTLFSFQE
uniref:GPS domain-containing protein n=1 Tax=Biomphalaria glabrata TaxID=6526 RepID=A0A2C9L9J3_BIOGL